MRHPRGPALAALLLTAAAALAGCGSGSGTASAGGDDLTITSPADGASVRVPFTLRWDSSVPLGPPDSGKDHVHVYVDGQENDYAVVTGHQFRVKNLSPGEHELEISLRHADHSPVGPTSTVTVTVGGGGGSPTPDDMRDTGGTGGGYDYGY